MIPRIIHRIWITGSPPASADMVRNGALWRELNPGWEVLTWAGPTGMRMKNACLYRRPPAADAHRYRADLLRLELLAVYGGVYADMDITPLRPLADLLPAGATAAAAYSPNLWKGQRVLSNAFMAAVPGHSWIARCVARMSVSVQMFRGQFLAMVTGPHHVNRCLQATDDVTILDTSKVYPTTRAEHSTAAMFHTWEHRAKLREEQLT
jgi:mannosyltransferase OCH1-like enzyme